MTLPSLDEVLPTDTLHVTPWPDPVLEAVGHDPRSAYVEQYWLGILGPSTTWLLRRLADSLEAQPDGFDLPLADTARSLGLGLKGGRHSPFVRALSRACQFRLADAVGDDGLAVRLKLPSLTRTQVARLPATLQDAHRAWQERVARVPDLEQRRHRARGLALSMLELGESVDSAERQLHRWKFHPALAHEAVRWATMRRHPSSMADAAAPGVPAADDRPSGDATDGDRPDAAVVTGIALPLPLPTVPPPRPRSRRRATPPDAA